MKRATGYLMDIILIGAVLTFLISIITLAFQPECDILRYVVLGSGLGSAFFFLVHITLEYLLGWEW